MATVTPNDLTQPLTGLRVLMVDDSGSVRTFTVRLPLRPPKAGTS